MKEIIGGRHAVYHALRAGRRRVFSVFLREGLRESQIAAILEESQRQGIPVKRESKAFFATRVPLETHQGVACEVEGTALVDLEDMLGPSDLDGCQRLLLLDGLQDPHNFGALLRTAICFGISGVIWGRDRAAPLSAVAMKAAAGAVEYLQLCAVTNLVSAMDRLKESSYWIYGAVQGAEQSLWDLKVPPAAALVLGGEYKGLRRLVREHCDALIRIPTVGPIESLNASVAGGIALAHFCLP